MAKTKGGGKSHSRDPVEEETDGIQKMRGKGKQVGVLDRMKERVVTASRRKEGEAAKKNKKLRIYDSPDRYPPVTYPARSYPEDDDEDEGPPPGFEYDDTQISPPMASPHMPPLHTSSPHLASTGSSHASASVGVRGGKPSRLARVREEDPASAVDFFGLSRTWELTAGIPEGGPRTPTVIPSFGGHIAHYLWESGEGYRDLKVFRFLKRPKQWDTVSEFDIQTRTIWPIMQESGLLHLGRCMSTHFDEPLLEAFVERWQPDTNTFHMPWGEMTITLHDVFHILRVPVTGRPLHKPRPLVDLRAGVAEALGFSSAAALEYAVRGETVGPPLYDHGAMHERDMISLGKHMGDDIAYRVFLFCLLGGTLFQDRSADRSRLLGWEYFMGPISDVPEYAWGAGALAWLYRELGKASRADARAMSGCVTLLQSWIYEYFPSVRPPRTLRQERRAGEALAGRWDSAETPSRGAGFLRERLDYYRRLLDNMDSRDVCWLPFGPHPDIEVPATTYRGLLRCADVGEFYDSYRVLRQFGYTQVVPPSIPVPLRAVRPKSIRTYAVQWAPADDRMWLEQDFIRFHRLHLMFERASAGGDVGPGYMEWFLEHSHPRIVAPANPGVGVPAELVSSIPSQHFKGL